MRILALGLFCGAIVWAEIFPGAPGATRKPDQTISLAESRAVTALVYSADGNSLTIIGAGRSAAVLDVKTGSLAGAPGAVPPAPGFTFHPGADDGKIQLLAPPLRTLEAGMAVRAAAVSPTHAAAGSAEGKLKLWTLENSAEPRELIGQIGAMNALAFSLDGRQLASAGADGKIRIWDTRTGDLMSTLIGHTAAVVALAFSPNGRTIASAGADGTLRFWTMPLPPVAPEDLARIEAAIPSKARMPARKPRRVLVFWRADAIQHKAGVPAANRMIELLAKKTGAFQADFSRDYDVLDPKILAKYDAIVMNSTAHLAIPDEAGKKALLDYVRGGGGVVGIHAAIDTFKDWPAGAEVIGATFGGHPFVPTGRWAVKVDEPDHALTRAFGGKGFAITDEIYEMGEPFTRADRRVLLSLDLTDDATRAITLPRPGKESIHREDHDFAAAWVKRYGQGKVFYAVFGHVPEPFGNPAIVQFYLDGIQYAIGDLAAADEPVTRSPR